ALRLGKSAVLPSLRGGREARARLILMPRRSGGTLRRAGLKIRWGSRPVWVRLPPSALALLDSQRLAARQLERVERRPFRARRLPGAERGQPRGRAPVVSAPARGRRSP